MRNIEVLANVTLGSVHFTFIPSPNEWVLYGLSFQQVEQAIRSEIARAFPEPVLQEDTAERIALCAQQVIDGLVARKLIQVRA